MNLDDIAQESKEEVTEKLEGRTENGKILGLIDELGIVKVQNNAVMNQLEQYAKKYEELKENQGKSQEKIFKNQKNLDEKIKRINNSNQMLESAFEKHLEEKIKNIESTVNKELKGVSEEVIEGIRDEIVGLKSTIIETKRNSNKAIKSLNNVVENAKLEISESKRNSQIYGWLNSVIALISILTITGFYVYDLWSVEFKNVVLNLWLGIGAILAFGGIIIFFKWLWNKVNY